MNYHEFCEWLRAERIELSFATIGNSGVNGVMQFCKDGEWFLNVRCNSDTDYFDAKEAILAELDDVDASSIYDVVTVTEVADLLGKDTSTIRKAIDKAIVDGILTEGKHCRKAKQLWLLKKIAIKKLYSDVSWKQIDSMENPDTSGML